MCAQWLVRLTWASIHLDQKHRCLHEETFGTSYLVSSLECHRSYSQQPAYSVLKATIGPSAKRHSNGVSLMGRWWSVFRCLLGSGCSGYYVFVCWINLSICWFCNVAAGTRPRGYKTWVQSETQNKVQWLAACGHVPTSSQSLHFILILRINSSFITSRTG